MQQEHEPGPLALTIWNGLRAGPSADLGDLGLGEAGWYLSGGPPGRDRRGADHPQVVDAMLRPRPEVGAATGLGEEERRRGRLIRAGLYGASCSIPLRSMSPPGAPLDAATIARYAEVGTNPLVVFPASGH
jgi:hypothetical protein